MRAKIAIAIGLSGLSSNSIAYAQAVDAQSSPQNPTGDGQAITEGGLGEIVVTARKQKERLQDTPLAISVISSDSLESKSITDVVALASGLPNVKASSGSQGSSDANFFIRGVGQTDFIITSEPGVALYVDGVYLARTVGALVDTPDVSRIEVLRGPQGTLFGRNAIGGAVSVVTKEPEFGKFAVQASATAGSRNRFDGDVAVNVPLGDRTAARLLVMTRNQDGWARRVLDGRTFGDVQRLAFRGSIKSEASDNLTLRLNADYVKDDGSALPLKSRGVQATGLPPGVSIPAGIEKEVGGPFYEVTNDIDPISRVRAGGVSLTAEFDLGGPVVRSISAYRELTAFSNGDYDGTSYALYNQSSKTKQHQYSQEIQLIGNTSNLKYVFGLFYFHEQGNQTQKLCIASFPTPRAKDCGFWYYENNQKTDSFAGYGELTYDLTNRLSITAGARYSYDRKQLQAVQNFDFTAFGGPFIPIVPNPGVPGATGLARESWSAFTPRLGLNFKVSPDALLYGTYSKGFRSGGFNGRLAVPGPIRGFSPDKNDTYELGLKSEFFDRRLRFNAAAFYSKYKDIQLRITDPVVQFYVANAAQAELYGLEAEITAKPTSRLQLDFNLGYVHSEFKEVSPALVPARVLAGNQLGETPKWTVNPGVQYTLPLKSGSTMTLRADYAWRSRVFFQPANQPLDIQKSFGLLNARLTWSSADDRHRVAVFGTNLTKTRYFTFGEDARFNQGVAYGSIGRPREFGVSYSVNY